MGTSCIVCILFEIHLDYEQPPFFRSLSSVKRKEKRAHENWGQGERKRSTKKLGTTRIATVFELCFALTMQKYDWVMLGASTTGRQHVFNTQVSIYDAMAVELQECLSQFPKIESLKLEQKEALEFLLLGRDVLAILPTGFG